MYNVTHNHSALSITQATDNPFDDPISSKGKEKKDETADKPASNPPRYEELYKGDGNYFTNAGKMRLLANDEHRTEFMQKNKLNTRFIHSEETAVLMNKKPIMIIDTSGSMHEKVKKGSTNIFGAIKNALTPRERRIQEQKREGIELLQILEAFCPQVPTMYNLNGGKVENASSVDKNTLRMYDTLGGGTPLTSTLQHVRRDLANSGETEDVAMYISTDGEPTEGRDRTDCRLRFENELRDLTNNGIPVTKTDGSTHNRTVKISMQYVGDDDDDYQYMTPFDNSTPERARASIKARMDEVRSYGSAGAYYSALDNERMGGVKGFDVNDDRASEINDAKKHGHRISKMDVTLKKALGAWVPRLDQMDESIPVSNPTFSTARRLEAAYRY